LDFAENTGADRFSVSVSRCQSRLPSVARTAVTVPLGRTK
jgi:hypothetical protein